MWLLQHFVKCVLFLVLVASVFVCMIYLCFVREMFVFVALFIRFCSLRSILLALLQRTTEKKEAWRVFCDKRAQRRSWRWGVWKQWNRYNSLSRVPVWQVAWSNDCGCLWLINGHDFTLQQIVNPVNHYSKVTTTVLVLTTTTKTVDKKLEEIFFFNSIHQMILF